jgi:fatty acid desaturase (delta-4 desaturase)
MNSYNIAQHEIIIDDSVYDLKAFSKVHPGGTNILNIFGGKDATVHYYMIHPHTSIHKNILEPYKLRHAYITDNRYLLNSIIFQDLKKRVHNAIKYPYATGEWYIKAIIIFSTAVYIEYHNIAYGFRFIKSIILGILMALIGLCIQHDANHNAISRNNIVNVLWGLTQDWIGGSSLLWRHHHVLLHHAYTNKNYADPDATTDVIRLHEQTKWKYFHQMQQLYVWTLLPLLPFNWHFKELYDLCTMNHMQHRICTMAKIEVYFAILLRILFLIRFYVIPLYMYPSLHTLLCIIATLLVGGAYLGINFIISHNFEGVKHLDHQYTEKDWCITQIETSSTVGGRWLGYLHGGLNYQIEHHLFPRICHIHYHKIQPIVQQWCKENNVKYTYFYSLYGNLLSCYKQLHKYGKNDVKIK